MANCAVTSRVFLLLSLDLKMMAWFSFQRCWKRATEGEREDERDSSSSSCLGHILQTDIKTLAKRWFRSRCERSFCWCSVAQTFVITQTHSHTYLHLKEDGGYGKYLYITLHRWQETEVPTSPRHTVPVLVFKPPPPQSLFVRNVFQSLIQYTEGKKINAA